MTTTEPILSPEQVETLRQLANGMTPKEIAARGQFERTTIRMRVVRAGRRMGLPADATTVHVVAEAMRRGLLARRRPLMPEPERSWRGTGANTLVLEGTNGNDGEVNLWIAAPHDGPGVGLTGDQCREIGQSLIRRAHLIGNTQQRTNGARP